METHLVETLQIPLFSYLSFFTFLYLPSFLFLMKVGYVYASGHFQIAKSTMLLGKNDLGKITSILASTKNIASVEPILDFSGIMGNEKTSAIFLPEGMNILKKILTLKKVFRFFQMKMPLY